MEPGRASRTAQAVAAYRRGFARVPGPDDGDPAADDRLAAAIAGEIEVDRSSRMGRYLQVRTAFFDRAVVAGMERGVTQIVNLGAGYDGRSLRYRHAGVRWFEVDHPDTQADKRRLLDELAVDVAGIEFVAIDFAADHDLAHHLAAAGLDPDAETLVTWEGVVNYLEGDAVLATLGQLRRATRAGSRLVVSVSTESDGAEDRHESFARAVARVGEPAAPRIPPALAVDLLDRTGWRAIEHADPDPTEALLRRLGLLVAEAV